MTTHLGQRAHIRPTHVSGQWHEHGPDCACVDPHVLTDAIRDRLRSPVSALEALRQAMSGHDLTPELRDRLRSHSKLLARTVGLLLEDLLVVHTHRRRHAGRPAEVVSLTRHLERAVSLFPDRAVTLSAGSDVHVMADPLRLQQLLVNLLRGSTNGGHPVRLTVVRETSLVLVVFRHGGAVPGHEIAMARLLAHLQGASLHLWPDSECALEVALPVASPTPGDCRARRATHGASSYR